MKQNKKYYILLLLSVWLISSSPWQLPAQTDKVTIVKKDFDKEKWEELTEGLDYSVDKIKERKIKTTPISRPNLNLWRIVFKFIGIIIFIGLIATLMYHLLDGGNLFSRRDKKINSKISAVALQELEENLLDSDVSGLIQQAIKNGEYSLAIRLSYLAAIKELSLTKRIKWKKNKTNRHYQRELRGTEYFSNFKEITVMFERIWYGDKLLTEVEFQPVYRKFSDFIAGVK